MVSTNVSQTAHDKIAVIGKKARAASLIMAKASSKQKNNVDGFARQESRRSFKGK